MRQGIDEAFGGSWQSRVQQHYYQSGMMTPSKQKIGLLQFQKQLNKNFRVESEIVDGKNKFYLFFVHEQNTILTVQMFLYSYKGLQKMFLEKKPQFIPNILSVFKLPLSEYQRTNFCFYSTFILIQTQTIYFTLEIGEKRNLLIQISQYQSDVRNYRFSSSRLISIYWKPQFIKRAQILPKRRVDFFTFIKILSKQIHQQFSLHQQILTWKGKNRIIQKISQYLSKSYRFIDVKSLKQQSYLQQFLSIEKLSKMNVTNVCRQYNFYISKQQQKNNSIKYVKAQFYDFQVCNSAFYEKQLLFSADQIEILEQPLGNNMLVNLISKRLILIIFCLQMIISFQVKLEQQLLIIRFLGKKDQDFHKILMKSNLLEEKSTITLEKVNFRQSHIFSLKHIIESIGEMKDVESIFGLKRQQVNVINRLFQLLQA